MLVVVAVMWLICDLYGALPIWFSVSLGLGNMASALPILGV